MWGGFVVFGRLRRDRSDQRGDRCLVVMVEGWKRLRGSRLKVVRLMVGTSWVVEMKDLDLRSRCLRDCHSRNRRAVCGS